jgi:hypothetical protein
LGEHLYERVAVTGEAVKDAKTRAMVEFRIKSFEVVKRTAFDKGLQELRELLEEDMEGFDPRAFLEEIRG